MKTLKIATIATALTLALITLFGFATAESAETYEVEAVVTCEYLAFNETWAVIATTQEGEQYGFFFENGDGEYYRIGDLVILTMWKADETGKNDEVLDVVLGGELTPVMMARWFKW